MNHLFNVSVTNGGWRKRMMTNINGDRLITVINSIVMTQNEDYFTSHLVNHIKQDLIEGKIETFTQDIGNLTISINLVEYYNEVNKFTIVREKGGSYVVIPSKYYDKNTPINDMGFYLYADGSIRRSIVSRYRDYQCLFSTEDLAIGAINNYWGKP
jgi:hypothetical protein